MMFYEGFSWYEESSLQMDELDAVNMTAIVADKGSNHPYLCLNNTVSFGKMVENDAFRMEAMF